MAEKTVGVLNTGGRKFRSRLKSRTRKSYTDDDPLGLKFKVPCKHSENSKFRCSSFNMRMVLKNRNAFYSKETKVSQDIYLSRLSHSYEPINTTKPKKNVKSRNVSCSYNLFVKKNKMKCVCKKMFSAVFSVSEKRLNSINKQTIQGNIPAENRGGDHKSHKSVNRKESLRQFLNGLPAKESHYNRQKSKRIYLSAELNCKKLLQLYNNSVIPELRVKKTMFYKIFHHDYNIGFSSPSSDTCSVCLLWSNKIKMEKDPSRKQLLITELRVHKLRSKAFYNHMKQDIPNSVSLCFDLQQVLPLPRTPIQDAFYARQISLYNFCIVNLDSKSPWFYSWDETVGNRGSTEISSALYHYLTCMDLANNVEIIRLFCDGCGGQNKNNYVLQTLIQWLFSKSPMHLKAIHMYFPVRGHSFLPADRVFGRLEKEIRKKTIINTRDGYDEILKRHGTLKLLRQDWQLLEIKDLKENFNNLEGLQKMKRIKIEKKVKRGMTVGCEIKAFENYRFETNEVAQTLLKRGKRIPREICTAVFENKELSANKKKDVNNLLTKQFGKEWINIQELAWYKDIINSCRPAPDTDMENPDESLCNCLDDDVGEVRI